MCPSNKCSGQLIFNNTNYICTGVGAWTKCDYQVKEPARKTTRLPKEILTKYPDLRSFSKMLSSKPRILHSFRTTDESGNDLVHG